MKEFLTEALVLDSENLAEYDKIINLYTKNLGRISAKAKGARKITSKLIGHLQPLDFTRVRLIKKGGFQIVDALSFKKIERTSKSFTIIQFIKEMTPELQPDNELWTLLKKKKEISIKDLLGFLGFDPAFAECANCNSKKPEFFLKTDQIFLCKQCASKTSKNEVILF